MTYLRNNTVTANKTQLSNGTYTFDDNIDEFIETTGYAILCVIFTIAICYIFCGLIKKNKD